MDLSAYIEHTILKPNASYEQIKQYCLEAQEHNFVGVCIPPFHIPNAAAILRDSNVKVVSVVGFPMGYSAISAKVEEAKRAVADGADEVDMVINIAAIKDAKWSHVHNDIDSVTRATHLKGKVMKVILETALLSTDEIRKACEICVEIGVDYVKTSTGINAAGATIEAVRLLKQSIAGSNLKIKASGGIRTAEFAQQLIQAGADRLGTSASLKIIGKEVISDS
jgi:deoxyribose-phosphate aldolase